MAGGLRVLSRSLEHYKPTTSILPENSLSLQSNQWIHQTRRTLILESAPSRYVTLHRLSDSDSNSFQFQNSYERVGYLCLCQFSMTQKALTELGFGCLVTGIVEVRLERPEVRNAIGRDMLRGLQSTFEAVSEDSSAYVLLIRSKVSKVFCAGADLKERKGMSASEVRDFVNTLRATFSFLQVLSIPTIAVIEGAALGGGLEMALSCDLRICGEDAVMGLRETGLAIIPGAGGTQRLPRLVGKAISKELIFTGRKIGGREAKSIGLANYCVPAGEAHLMALEVACNINEKGPIAIRMAKKAIDEGLQVDKASALALEEQCYEQTLNINDRLEALAAFSEKRKPKYTGA